MNATLHEAAHYIPGGRGSKLFVMAVGAILFVYGLSQLWAPLFLLLHGSKTTAEVTRIIKTKDGLPDQSFADDLHGDAAKEKRDRSYIFWNEFRYGTSDGVVHTVRFSIGSQLKPLYSILDEDGLPTTVQVYYDVKDPTRICIPTVLSTWFAPGLIAFMGLACVLIGTTLFYWSNRRIETP